MKLMAFTEAIEFFRDKVAMTPAEYDALVASVGEYANSMAFTVSRITSADVLQGLHDAISRAIEEGTTFWDFREDVDALMEKLGWEGMAPYRLDNLYRTNVQTAYNVGRHKQMKAIANRRPYWEYDAVNDSRTRPSHLAHDGKIYHNTHPFWDTWYPPNGYRCRCKVNSLSAAEMGEEGLTESTQGTDLKPDEGFDFNPAEQKWQPDLSRYSEGLRNQVEQDLESVFD